ncbi:MAG: hypothetical protein M0O96_05045 [Desulforhopalus sp.]|nr:hypothetical protein [Desulforhopalus sp.]
MGICELDVTIVAGAQGNGVPAWCHETVQGSAAEAAVGIPGLVLKKQLFSLLHEGGQAKGADAIVQQHFDAVHVGGESGSFCFGLCTQPVTARALRLFATCSRTKGGGFSCEVGFNEESETSCGWSMEKRISSAELVQAQRAGNQSQRSHR